MSANNDLSFEDDDDELDYIYKNENQLINRDGYDEEEELGTDINQVKYDMDDEEIKDWVPTRHPQTYHVIYFIFKNVFKSKYFHIKSKARIGKQKFYNIISFNKNT